MPLAQSKCHPERAMFSPWEAECHRLQQLEVQSPMSPCT